MKKVFWLIVFFVAINFSFSFGQITYETSSSWRKDIIYFNHRSPKWMTMTNANNIYLHNLNHSQYQHIIIPPQPLAFAVLFITDDLFDTDSTNLEYLITTFSNITPYFTKVYREDGTLLFQRDSAIMNMQALLSNSHVDDNIMVTDSGVKMGLYILNGVNNHYEIYSLPGHLPCKMTCSEHVVSEGFPTEINETAQKNFNNPYPNPTQGQTHIPYTLPDGETSGEIIFYDMAGAEVRRYKVDRTFSDLILSTSDLSAGSYYYQLQTPRSKSEGRKLVVIK